MATNTTTGTGSWSDTSKWDLGHVPTAGEDVVVSHTMTMDVVRIPATSGTLNSLTGVGIINVDVDNALFHDALGGGDGNINATTITAGAGSGLISLNTTASTHYFKIKATTISGGSTSYDRAIILATRGYVTVEATTMNAGTGSYSFAIDGSNVTLANLSVIATTINGVGSATNGGMAIFMAYGPWSLNSSCNLVNSQYGMAIGGCPPTWTPDASASQKWGSVYFSQAPPTNKVATDTSVVNKTTGTYESGTYSGGGGVIVATPGMNGGIN